MKHEYLNNKIGMLLKTVIVLIAIFTSCVKIAAQDVISFTWYTDAKSQKGISIKATKGKMFSIDWGDTKTDTVWGAGNASLVQYHEYSHSSEYTVAIIALDPECRFTAFDCGIIKPSLISSMTFSDCSALSYLNCPYNLRLTTLDLTGCTSLSILDCSNNRLTDLKLPNTSTLFHINIRSNQFLLSSLYAISLISGLSSDYLYLGTQSLQTQTIALGGVIDYSNEAEFGGIATEFTVTKNWLFAIIDIDYSIDNGIITFHTPGNFTIEMRNYAIYSYLMYPARVISRFNVIPVGLHENYISNIKVYPNPTKDMFLIDCEGFSIVMLYDMFGKEVLNQNINGKSEINISHLPKGIYNVRVVSENKAIGNSKIVKQ